MNLNKATRASSDANIQPPSTPTVFRPIWLRITEASRLFGLGRSTLYTLIGEGRIRTKLVKTRRDAVSGIRLISFDSLDQFIKGHVEGVGVGSDPHEPGKPRNLA
jgi:excisionase family DNA binding protein